MVRCWATTTVFLRADTTAQNSTRCKRMKGAAMIYETDLTRVYYTTDDVIYLFDWLNLNKKKSHRLLRRQKNICLQQIALTIKEQHTHKIAQIICG